LSATGGWIASRSFIRRERYLYTLSLGKVLKSGFFIFCSKRDWTAILFTLKKTSGIM
jgi:hypothetical protein